MRYDALAAHILGLNGPVRLVGVDGGGGAGKTTFAARLSRAAGDCQVVHTDDFASWDEPLEWWPRLLSEVIEPLLAGQAATYRHFEWDPPRHTDEIRIEPALIVIIEGVSATRSEWADRLALSVWISTPHATRLERGLTRDGDEAAERWAGWMAEEDAYAACDRPMDRADVVVDGARSVGEPKDEFVLAAQPAWVR
jgi:uridine kinase